MTKKYYEARKARAREEAISWQYSQALKAMSYSECYELFWYFYRLGVNYGLLKEFRENGII